MPISTACRSSSSSARRRPAKAISTRFRVGSTRLPLRATSRNGLTGSVTALIDLLQAAERPVVIAGGGATLSRSAEALLAFAEATGIPVTTGMKGEGLMPQDHPLYGGSMVSVPIAAAIGAPADVVVLLG